MVIVAKFFCGRRIACVKKVKSKEGFYKVFSGAAGKGKFLGEVREGFGILYLQPSKNPIIKEAFSELAKII